VHIQCSTNYFKIDLEGLSEEHINFFHTIKTLLESQEVFKKFSQGGELGSRQFDPLCGISPEKKGFGKRIFALNEFIYAIDDSQNQLNELIEDLDEEDRPF